MAGLIGKFFIVQPKRRKSCKRKKVKSRKGRNFLGFTIDK